MRVCMYTCVWRPPGVSWAWAGPSRWWLDWSAGPSPGWLTPSSDSPYTYWWTPAPSLDLSYLRHTHTHTYTHYKHKHTFHILSDSPTILYYSHKADEKLQFKKQKNYAPPPPHTHRKIDHNQIFKKLEEQMMSRQFLSKRCPTSCNQSAYTSMSSPNGCVCMCWDWLVSGYRCGLHSCVRMCVCVLTNHWCSRSWCTGWQLGWYLQTELWAQCPITDPYHTATKGKEKKTPAIIHNFQL